MIFATVIMSSVPFGVGAYYRDVLRGLQSDPFCDWPPTSAFVLIRRLQPLKDMPSLLELCDLIGACTSTIHCPVRGPSRSGFFYEQLGAIDG